ncbi:hypothetical protein NPIL_553111 [Nephila pilipes]|uniref:Uncharacterized protein n=1 Tax=Nephila pilipes TaxID=299642 RepID=A0A8X6U806_NEPPI|nr:hypothetical protein NPIL_553111 [Nephila pilipes]
MITRRKKAKSLQKCRMQHKTSKGTTPEMYSDLILVNLIVENPEVIVMSHKPLYNGMDVFSYIGGLMGCWLGISVWACTGIAEATFWTFLHYFKQLAKKSRHSPPTRNQLLFRRSHHTTLVF